MAEYTTTEIQGVSSKPYDTLTVSLTISDIISKVRTHLSVIGKRAKDAKGELLFSDITLSSVEDKAILNDYILSGAETILNHIKEFGASFSYNATTMTFTIKSTRWADANHGSISGALGLACTKYIVYYAIMQYLNIMNPAFASGYNQHLAIILDNITSLCNAKRDLNRTSNTYSQVKVQKQQQANNLGGDSSTEL